jgi:hypothetical protein
MKIQYMQMLKDNPVCYGVSANFTNRGYSLERIKELENKYNNGNPFPKALSELLYLAGDFCYGLDRPYDTEEENQDLPREELIEYNRQINHPFFVIEIILETEHFLYVRLDEGENPHVYEACLYHEESPFSKITGGDTLSQYIEYCIKTR